MKKVICVAGAVMLFASMVFAEPITKKNLGSLKGTWEGFASGVRDEANLKLEIMNDAEPVEAKITVSNIPAGDWKQTYLMSDPSTERMALRSADQAVAYLPEFFAEQGWIRSDQIKKPNVD